MQKIKAIVFVTIVMITFHVAATYHQVYAPKPTFFSVGTHNSNEGGILKYVPEKTPFSYDLNVQHILSGAESDAVTICCHGYGHNSSIVSVIDSYHALSGHLIGFNFPDHDITANTDHNKSVYGTIDEILPLLYLVKYYACDLKVSVINLYGFSAGGGAVINALAIMNQYFYKERLWHVAGISRGHIAQMLAAVGSGFVILDCPLKSFNEIMALRGRTPALEIMASRYAKNHMNPIDVLQFLWKLKLTIILHFQSPDEVLGNRDDALFIRLLKHANKGTTHVIVSSDGGHNAYHAGLWNKFKNQNNRNYCNVMRFKD